MTDNGIKFERGNLKSTDSAFVQNFVAAAPFVGL
jgi:hypothetical protein